MVWGLSIRARSNHMSKWILKLQFREIIFTKLVLLKYYAKCSAYVAGYLVRKRLASSKQIARVNELLGWQNQTICHFLLHLTLKVHLDM
jgi:hypothetical protein